MKVHDRLLSLLNLLNNEKNYKQISYFAHALNVSERTIHHDLEKIQEIDKDNLIIIERTQNKGILLVQSLSKTQKFIEGFMSQMRDLDSYDRMSEIIRLIAVEEKTVTYLSLSEALYSSTSVIIKDMQEIRNMNMKGVEIQSNRSGTRFIGSEYYRQKLIKTFYLNYVKVRKFEDDKASRQGFLSTIFDPDVVYNIFEIMEEIEDVAKNTIEQSYLISLELMLIVITDRVSRGKHYDKDINELSVDYIETLKNFPYALSVVRLIEDKCEILFNDEEIRHISYQFFLHKIEVNVNNKYLENMYQNDVKNIIDFVSKELGLDLNKDTRLFNSLMFHIIPLNYRVRSNIKIQNPIYTEVVAANTKLFYIVLMALKNFEDKYDITLNNDEISFISIHFQVALAYIQKRHKAYVVCETGLLTSELLMSKMKQQFPKDLNVEAISKEELKEMEYIDANFIITTVDLEDKFHPYIKVSLLVTDEDMRSVYDYYLKYRNNNYKDSLSSKVISDGSLITKENIYLNKKFKSKEELFMHADKIIKGLEGVHDGVMQSIIDRENVGSTIIAKNVGLPHSNPQLSDKTHMLFYTLDKPIKWDNKHEVKVVILVVLSREDGKDDLNRFILLHEYMSQYENVVNLLNMDEEHVIKELENIR